LNLAFLVRVSFDIGSPRQPTHVFSPASAAADVSPWLLSRQPHDLGFAFLTFLVLFWSFIGLTIKDHFLVIRQRPMARVFSSLLWRPFGRSIAVLMRTPVLSRLGCHLFLSRSFRDSPSSSPPCLTSFVGASAPSHCRFLRPFEKSRPVVDQPFPFPASFSSRGPPSALSLRRDG